MKENKNWKKQIALFLIKPESVDVRFVSSGLFDRLVYYRND